MPTASRFPAVRAYIAALLGAAGLLTATGLAGCDGVPSATPPDTRPNIILVSIDSLRADHLGAYGYAKPTSPFIDRLASEGAIFRTAISSTSWTLPAHAALFTGLADSAHGTVTPKSRLAESYDTLAERLGAEGYTTIGLYSGPFLHPDFGLAQGFGRYLDCTSFGVGERDPRRSHSASHRDVTNPVLLSRAKDVVAQLGEEPYFLFVHMWDVHYDLIAPAKYRKMFDEGYRGSFDGRDFRHAPGFTVGMDEADFAHVLALYDAEIRYTDDTLAAIIALLEAAGRLENTVIVVVADHGDEFLDHGDKGHRHTLYQEVIRIPLVVWMPGRIAPIAVETPVSITDVAPTLLELAGAAPLPEAMGRSLAAALDGNPLEPKPVLAELSAPPRVPNSTALLHNGEKIIVDHARNKAIYFNLERDPYERSPSPAKRSKSAAALLQALVDAKKRAASIAAGHTPVAPMQLPDEMRERLEKLGYLE